MSASPTPFRPALTASLLTAAAGGALALSAVAAAPGGVRAPLGWFAACGVLLLSAAAFAVTWYGRTSRVLARRAETLAAEVASKDAYVARSTAAAERETATLRDRQEADTAAARAAHAAQAEEIARSHAAETAVLVREHAAETAVLVREHSAETALLETRLRRAESGRSAAMAAAANAAGRMQALATSMLADLREMEHRHADEDVLTDLLHLDHRTAQAGRLADSVAVLSGARSGRRWARPIVMESILRGAMGRISGYQRVRLHSSSDAAVAGHAAEGVMHALAELMDNAANFSPPTAEVHVYVEEVPAGVIIAVEDSGLVMSDVQQRRAEAAVGSAPQDLAGLSGTRLGLAVVGRLARKHGLTVSFRPSARGGTGALLMLPQELISHAPAEPAAMPADTLPPVSGRGLSAPATTSATTSAAADAPDAVPEPETVHDSAAESTGEHPRFGESGLPQRRRGRAMAAAHPEGPQAAGKTSAEGPRSGAAAGAANRFGTFRRAVRGTTARPDGEPEGGPVPETTSAPAASTGDERPGSPTASASASGDERPGSPTASASAADRHGSPAVPTDPVDPTSAPRTPSPTSNPPYPEGTS
ncbi:MULTISPECIES: sensor histidine kinase KdpD [unclassified Streptomyces]|uniref:sensor histidine kinase n=1 Tax=unclassified Streptomyces TaxID=2593676 RepID=UPI001E3F1963|nr:ATP-binding protein [Streptomyces sp. CB02980]MCB8906911.1 ATP-binding protein [Streptomyces sp. CB02980]